jgi:hypothetical protein
MRKPNASAHLIAEAAFLNATSCYFASLAARDHARALAGSERAECYAHARSLLRRARFSMASIASINFWTVNGIARSL